MNPAIIAAIVAATTASRMIHESEEDDFDNEGYDDTDGLSDGDEDDDE